MIHDLESLWNALPQQAEAYAEFLKVHRWEQELLRYYKKIMEHTPWPVGGDNHAQRES